MFKRLLLERDGTDLTKSWWQTKGTQMTRDFRDKQGSVQKEIEFRF